MIKKLHEQLIKKQKSAVEITQEYLERAKKSDLNAFITLTEQQALAQAKLIDEKISAGEPISELAGIPCSIKDIILVKDIRATGGSKILDNYISSYDATLVAKLKEQGVVIIGKNNCDEFAMGSSNETSAYGSVKNPHNTELVPGGSSGGSAASVAENTSVFSIGTDTGGSIRQPSALCGVVGLKPTYGAVSRSGLMAMASSLDQAGVIGQSIEDVKIVFDIISGKDNLDATSITEEQENRETNKQIDFKKLKIGVPKEYFAYDFDPEIKSAVEDTINQAEKLGAKIVQVSLPHTEYALAVYYIIMPSEVSSNMARYDGIRYGMSEQSAKNLSDIYKKTRGQYFGDEVKRRILLGTYALSAGYYDAYYKKAQQVRTLIRQDFEQVFDKVDLLITPTTPHVAWKIGEKKDDPLSMYLEDIFTVPVNIAGLPGLSIPVGKTKSNLPIGAQLIGKWNDEELLFAVANHLTT